MVETRTSRFWNTRADTITQVDSGASSNRWTNNLTCHVFISGTVLVYFYYYYFFVPFSGIAECRLKTPPTFSILLIIIKSTTRSFRSFRLSSELGEEDRSSCCQCDIGGYTIRCVDAVLVHRDFISENPCHQRDRQNERTKKKHCISAYDL